MSLVSTTHCPDTTALLALLKHSVEFDPVILADTQYIIDPDARTIEIIGGGGDPFASSEYDHLLVTTLKDGGFTLQHRESAERPWSDAAHYANYDLLHTAIYEM